MKKKMILTGLFGALVGVALSTLITLAISLMHNNGYYYAVVPELIAFCRFWITPSSSYCSPG